MEPEFYEERLDVALRRLRLMFQRRLNRTVHRTSPITVYLNAWFLRHRPRDDSILRKSQRAIGDIIRHTGKVYSYLTHFVFRKKR